MTNLVTADEVRTICGIGSDQISDSDVDEIITDVQSQLEKYLGTKLTATKTIDILDGEAIVEDRIFLNNTPVLSLRAVKTDTTDIDIDDIEIYSESGMLRLKNTATSSTFIAEPYKTKVKYVFGWLDRDYSTQTTTTSASGTGSSVQVYVDDVSNFTVGDWVWIYGMDGNQEAAEVSGTGANYITVDELGYEHESGSYVVKLVTPDYLKRLLKILVALAMVARVVGQSYDDIVGYSLGDMSVQKGEPYTQWRETAMELIKERDEILKRIKPRIVVRI